MLFCCMAAALLLACSNDKSDGEGREPGVETELNGTQLGEGTTLYGLVTDTSGNPVQGVVVSDGYNCVETDANGVYQMIRYTAHALPRCICIRALSRSVPNHMEL